MEQTGAVIMGSREGKGGHSLGSEAKYREQRRWGKCRELHSIEVHSVYNSNEDNGVREKPGLGAAGRRAARNLIAVLFDGQENRNLCGI